MAGSVQMPKKLERSFCYEGLDDAYPCLEDWALMTGRLTVAFRQYTDLEIGALTQGNNGAEPSWMTIADVVDITCDHVFSEKHEEVNGSSIQSKDYALKAEGKTAEGKKFKIEFSAVITSEGSENTRELSNRYPTVTWLASRASE